MSRWILAHTGRPSSRRSHSSTARQLSRPYPLLRHGAKMWYPSFQAVHVLRRRAKPCHPHQASALLVRHHPDAVLAESVLLPYVGPQLLPVLENPIPRSSRLPGRDAVRVGFRKLPDDESLCAADLPGQAQLSANHPLQKLLVRVLRALHREGGGEKFPILSIPDGDGGLPAALAARRASLSSEITTVWLSPFTVTSALPS